MTMITNIAIDIELDRKIIGPDNRIDGNENVVDHKPRAEQDNTDVPLLP